MKRGDEPLVFLELDRVESGIQDDLEASFPFPFPKSFSMLHRRKIKKRRIETREADPSTPSIALIAVV